MRLRRRILAQATKEIIFDRPVSSLHASFSSRRWDLPAAPLSLIVALGAALIAFALGLSLVSLSENYVESKAPERRVNLRLKRRAPTNLRKTVVSSNKAQQKKEAEKESDSPRGQIVKVAKPDRVEAPEKADFVSEWDRKVERETRARRTSKDFPQVSDAPKSGQLARQEQRQKQSQSGGGGQQGDRIQGAKRPKSKNAAEGLPQKSKEQSKGINGQEEPFAKKAKSTSNKREQDLKFENDAAKGIGGLARAGFDPGLPSLNELVPSVGSIQNYAGMPSNDYLPEVDSGDATLLNTRRWRYASFFNRIRDAVSRVWNPRMVIRPEDFNLKDRFLTRLVVTMRNDGAVTGLRVKDSSGHSGLDREAKRAFRRAAPFVNPPSGLFKGRDEIDFEFGFVVEMNDIGFDFNWAGG